MFEERKNLLNNMAAREKHGRLKGSYSEKAEETQVHIERIRLMLHAPAPEVGEKEGAPVTLAVKSIGGSNR
jgi:hypothetical protein